MKIPTRKILLLSLTLVPLLACQTLPAPVSALVPTPIPTSLSTPIPYTEPSPMPPSETILILQPGFLDEVSGGRLVVSGFSEYFFEANLSMMLCGAGGSGAAHQICGTVDNVLAEGYATIDSPDMGIPGPFVGELAYTVATQVRAKVVVYAVSPRDGAIIHLSSQEITLNP